MTNRLLYPNVWAQNGTAVDPDLDTTAPSYIPDRYKTIGWKAEKPPEGWENFLTQITDLKMQDLISEGINYWESTVSYNINAVVREPTTGIYYRNVKGSASLNEVPSATSAVWKQILATDKATWDAAVKDVKDTYAAHMAASNPHVDTIALAGGVLKTYFLPLLNSPTDPKTIVYHEALRGQVHDLTPAQAGTLPVAGGTFTGDIKFTKRLVFEVASNAMLLLDTATGMSAITARNVSILVDSSGAGWIKNTAGVLTKIVSIATFISSQNAIQNQFQLPIPLFSFNTLYSLSDVDGIGYKTATSDADLEFVPGKGMLLGTNVIVVDIYNLPSTTLTYYVTGWDEANSRMVRVVKDTTRTSFANYGSFIKALAPGITHVISLEAYQTLTAYQKLRLTTKV
jgi:hypothetical protein